MAGKRHERMQRAGPPGRPEFVHGDSFVFAPANKDDLVTDPGPINRGKIRLIDQYED